MPLKDGDELWCGVVKLRVIHTPGHRPEHTALVVSDTSRSDDPWLVLTGDSLFIGDVAQPDLAVVAKEGADALYESIFIHGVFWPEPLIIPNPVNHCIFLKPVALAKCIVIIRI